MWCNKILVAYDGSALSRKAFELALEVAKSSTNIEILLVHVVKIYSSGAAVAGINTTAASNIDPLKELEELAAGTANPLTSKVISGSSPADLIVQCAAEEGCDLIIMGSRGHGGVTGYLGSVSYAVTKTSPVTVMIVKD